MRLAAVCTAYHEDDILPHTIQHLLAEGVDDIWIAIKGEPPLRLPPYEGVVHWVEDNKSFHDQPYWIDWLAAQARADWVIAFDADEFFYSTDPTKNLKQTLEALPETVGVCYVGMLQQHGWWYREYRPKPASKVVYRWNPNAHVGPGNHGVEGIEGEGAFGVIMLREIQFRGYEHFKRKVAERNATLDRELQKKIPELGFHMTKLADASEADLRKEWDALEAVPTLWDPIPTTIDPGLLAGELPSPQTISQIFGTFLDEPSDMAGHLERLRDLVLETDAQTILELGVNTGVSTVGWLHGLESTGGSLWSCDIGRVRVRPEVRDHPQWFFHQGDSLSYVPPVLDFDIAFFDTSHTVRQTIEELKRFEPFVRPGGCLVLHDLGMPQVDLAAKHFLKVLAAKDRAPTKIETYTHSMGLMVIWLP